MDDALHAGEDLRRKAIAGNTMRAARCRLPEWP